MRMVVVLAVVLILGATTMGCTSTVSEDSRVGPNLISETEARSLARRETPLVDITESYLQTCGPIYRVLKGRTDDGKEIFVWVSDQIVAQTYSDDGISADDAMKQIKQQFPGSTIDGVRLVYVPDWAKASPSSIGEIKTAPVNIFWQVTCSFDNTDQKVEHFVPCSGEILDNQTH